MLETVRKASSSIGLFIYLLQGISVSMAQPLPTVGTPAESVLGAQAVLGDIQLFLIGDRTYQLREVSVDELGQPQRFNASQQGLAIASGSRSLTVNFSAPNTSLSPVLTRRIDRVWRVTAPVDQSISSPPVRAQWDSLSQLMTASDGGTGLSVSLTILVQGQGVDQETGLAYWEGGVRLQIPVEQLRGETRYSGRLLIFMENL